MERDIGDGEIGNYIGGLRVKEEKGRFYWSIRDYSGFYWEEIPEYLYRALMKYEDERCKTT